MTQSFLVHGGWGEEFHKDLLRAVSDLAWCGYTRSETEQKLAAVPKSSSQRAQVREVIRWFARTKQDWKDNPDDEERETAIS